MTKKKISQLPTASALDGTELIETVQGGVNKKTTTQAISDLIGGSPVNTYRKVDSDNDTIISSDYVLSINNGASVWTITLPSAVGITGKVYILKRFDNTSTGTIIIASAGGNIQNTTNLSFGATVQLATLASLRGSSMYMSNGTDWEYIK